MTKESQKIRDKISDIRADLESGIIKDFDDRQLLKDTLTALYRKLTDQLIAELKPV